MTTSIDQRLAAGQPVDDGLARPRDFAARPTDGVELALAFGGGGLFLLAWHVAYLHELAEHGIHLDRAGRVVGTSAGSVMATGLVGGKLARLHRTIGLLDRSPQLIGRLAPAGELQRSQARALNLFWHMADAEPATVQAIGHAALAARTPSASSLARTVGAFLGVRRWPSPALHVTCVDAYTGERCVVTEASKVHPARAVAASSAIPGVFAPQPVGDRSCMDGGVSHSGVHLDLVAGARRAVVLMLPDYVPSDAQPGLGSVSDVHGELDELRAGGTEVFVRMPDDVDQERLMDPTMVPVAFAMGHRQARADVGALQEFLAG